jgi:hypothetical protein
MGRSLPLSSRAAGCGRGARSGRQGLGFRRRTVEAPAAQPVLVGRAGLPLRWGAPARRRPQRSSAPRPEGQPGQSVRWLAQAQANQARPAIRGLIAGASSRSLASSGGSPSGRELTGPLAFLLDEFGLAQPEARLRSGIPSFVGEPILRVGRRRPARRRHRHLDRACSRRALDRDFGVGHDVDARGRIGAKANGGRT